MDRALIPIVRNKRHRTREAIMEGARALMARGETVSARAAVIEIAVALLDRYGVSA
jgi:hypothetical protein